MSVTGGSAGSGVAERLLAVAQRLSPELETLHGRERAFGVFDVVGSLCTAPLVLVALVWLAAVTDLTLLRTSWPVLSLLFILLFVFGRLGFFLFVEVIPGTQYDWDAALVTVIAWSAALIFGPTGLWPFVLWDLTNRAYQWRTARSIGSRWNLLRNFTLTFTASVLGGLVALTLYGRWGGVFPLPGLAFRQILPALGATCAWCLLIVLVWVPPVIYFGSSKVWDVGLTGGARGMFIAFVVGSVGWLFLANPFAVLAAGLYAQNGLGGYLFFAAGLLLASLLAHQLSYAVERSRQRSRELEKLERLGQALLNAPPDASTLPAVLQEHVSTMFPDSQIEVRLFPDQTVLRHPDDRPPASAAAWEWLRTTPEARCFLPGTPLPWGEKAGSDGVVVAPVLSTERPEPIGGIYLAQQRLPKAVASRLPAVQSLAAQIGSALYRAETYAQTLAHQRVEQELALAGQIQASFLPKDLPHVPGWELAATLEPARETCGDFYDVIPLPNGQFGILVADVADKGLGAALFMALSRTLLRTYALQYHARPDYVLRVTNRRILMDTAADMFVTVFYGVLDPAAGTLTYCNAGHNPPYLLSGQNGNAVRVLRRTGMALGVLENMTWEQETVRLAPGDALVLYTDGITDAEDENGTFFGQERLLEAVQASRGRSAREVQDALIERVHAFAGLAPQFDDITLMIVTHAATT